MNLLFGSSLDGAPCPSAWMELGRLSLNGGSEIEPLISYTEALRGHPEDFKDIQGTSPVDHDREIGDAILRFLRLLETLRRFFEIMMAPFHTPISTIS